MTHKVLISPQEQRIYQTGWTDTTPPKPIYDGIGCRIAQELPVGAEEFPVAEPLFWIDCLDEIVPDVYVYNMDDAQFYLAQWELPASDVTA